MRKHRTAYGVDVEEMEQDAIHLNQMARMCKKLVEHDLSDEYEVKHVLDLTAQLSASVASDLGAILFEMNRDDEGD